MLAIVHVSLGGPHITQMKQSPCSGANSLQLFYASLAFCRAPSNVADLLLEHLTADLNCFYGSIVPFISEAV